MPTLSLDSAWPLRQGSAILTMVLEAVKSPSGLGRWLIHILRECRLQLQVGVGLLVCVLPIFVRQLNFPLACLTPIWFLVAKLLIVQDPSVGSHCRVAAVQTGALSWGIVWGSSLASLAKLAHSQGQGVELGLLCALGALGLVPLSACRPAASPPLLWVMALKACLMLGVVFIATAPLPTAALVWTAVARYLLLSSLLASAVLVLVSLLPWPALASRAISSTAAKVLRQAAGSLEDCVPLLLLA
ncbi:hypothetical protein V8C86DRAFT_3031171, partial [Haematococcus lacustris]